MKNGKVIKLVDSETLVIDLGTEDGVENGVRYQIYGLGDDIFDPESNEFLGVLEVIRGTGRVVHAQQKFSTIKSDMKSAPTKTIRKKTNTQGLSGLAAITRFATASFPIEEEYLPAETVSFESPEIGDKIRRI